MAGAIASSRHHRSKEMVAQQVAAMTAGSGSKTGTLRHHNGATSGGRMNAGISAVTTPGKGIARPISGSLAMIRLGQKVAAADVAGTTAPLVEVAAASATTKVHHRSLTQTIGI